MELPDLVLNPPSFTASSATVSSVLDTTATLGAEISGDGGAVVYRGEQDGLHTRVFRNKLGLPTYEAKDLGLVKAKYGNARYHMLQILNLLEDYSREVIESAIDRATMYTVE